MKKITLFTLLIFCASALFAQQIRVLSQKVPQQVPFAQPFDVRFEIDYTTGYQPQLDRQSIPADFAITAVKTQQPQPGKQIYDITLLPFTLGVSTFTAVNFHLMQPGKEEPLAASKGLDQPIQVTPVKHFDDSNLRDIRPPYIPANLWGWLLTALLLGAAAYGVYRFIKARRQTGSVVLAAAADNRPAEEIALSKIQALLQSGLWEKKQYKIFYIELGDILREYFWRRFDQDVSADTSAELLRRARQVPQLTPLLMPLRQYLTSADLVKFAQVTPQTQTMYQDVQTVRNIVEQTTPQETAPAREEK